MTKKDTVDKPVNEDPVAQVATEVKAGEIITLSTGVRVKLTPVPAPLIDAVGSKIKEPDIPVFKDEDSGRETANPLDPIYIRDMEEVRRLRGLASLDAMAMWGVELVDGLPPDDDWLPKLMQMEELGMLDITKAYDLTNPIVKELVYKKFVGVTTDVIMKVTELSGISQEDITAAEESFPSQ